MIKPTLLSTPESSSSSLTTTSTFSEISSPISRLRLDAISSPTLSSSSLSTKPSSSSSSSLKSQHQKLASVCPSVRNMSQMLGLKSDDKMSEALKMGIKTKFAINFYLRDYYSSSQPLAPLATEPIDKIIDKTIDNETLDDLNIEIKNKEFPIEIIEYIATFLDYDCIMTWSSINQMHRIFCLESESLWSRLLLESNYCCEYIDNDDHYFQMVGGKFLTERETIQAQQDGILSVIKLEDQLDKPFVRNIYDGNNNCYLYKLYKLCKHFFENKVCLTCFKPNSIVPFIYGFPSDTLMTNHKRLYILNGDYVFDSSPLYCCLHCKDEFQSSPHKICTLEALAEELLNVCF